jgi:hypothetical protein
MNMGGGPQLPRYAGNWDIRRPRTVTLHLYILDIDHSVSMSLILKRKGQVVFESTFKVKAQITAQ